MTTGCRSRASLVVWDMEPLPWLACSCHYDGIDSRSMVWVTVLWIRLNQYIQDIPKSRQLPLSGRKESGGALVLCHCETQYLLEK